MLLLAVGMMVAVTSCGSGDNGAQDGATQDQATDNGGDDTANLPEESSDADGSGESGNSEPPDSLSPDFAVGIAPGWVFDALGDIGMTNTTGAQLYYPEGAFEDVVAYYDDWTESQSVEYSRTEANGDIVYQSLESPIVLITVTPEFEERGETYTYLLIATGSDG